jgi:ATP-dependent DNA helicase RecG
VGIRSAGESSGVFEMAIETVAITAEQAELLLKKQEGHFFDGKSIEIKPSKLTKSISALANADGGELYVGFSEPTPGAFEWVGFAREEDANAHLQVFESLFPLGTDFEYCFLTSDGHKGFVLQVVIAKTKDIKRASDGTPYLRRGPQSLPVGDAEGLRRLEYAKGISSFENEKTAASPDELTNSTPTIEFMINVVPSAEPDSWLKKQQLVKENKATVAGVLLFADEPQALLPKHCGIKIYRYKTKEDASRESLAFDPITIEGWLYKQIQDAVSKATETVEEIPRLGTENLEKISYPSETLHEIITNAILHRDYSITDDVHIRIFDNRIEVQSPGRLPAHVTVANILDERSSRNGAIVRLLNKFPDAPNKDVGEGLNTAFEAMTKLGLKPPTILELESSVLVTIRHEPLASPEQAILDYLQENDWIKNADARRVTHIQQPHKINNVFREMEARGLIKRKDGSNTSGRAYTLA